ncbi:MAG: GH36-type glycosyl hydrolase domain-containing protein [Stenotrophomonas sp.]
MSSRSPLPVEPPPQVKLLGNGRYTVMVNAAGAGYSQWCGRAVTRWREDPVADGWGSHLLLRDEDSGEVWSAGLQPCGDGDDTYEVEFGEGQVRLGRHHGSLQTQLEIVVAADRDLEWRRLTISNHGLQPRQLSVTSYAELVLGPAGADAAHPAFSKMFVQTEWVAHGGILLATRRRRTPDDQEIWAAHRATVDTAASDDGNEYESDRLRFLGRGRTVRRAQAMQTGATLSCAHGSVLDPVFSLRRRLTLAPGARVQVTFSTAVAGSRADALALSHSLDAPAQDLPAAAAAHARAEQTRLGISAAQRARFDGLNAPLLYADPAFKPAADVGAIGGAALLWSCGISGDRPLVLLRIGNAADSACLHELLLAQRYWQSLQLGVDVVVLDTTAGGDNTLLANLQSQLSAHNAQLKLPAPAATAQAFVLAAHALSEEQRSGLATAARIVLEASQGLPAAPRVQSPRGGPAAAPAALSAATIDTTPSAQMPGEREFDNGIGGFSDDGRSYRIDLRGDQRTPMPWVNVIANPGFGFLVSAEGGGYTWSGNSQQNPLTPWPNDPVSDVPHEVLYLRDAHSGQLWSATAAPRAVPGARYRTEHGKGWSRFSHVAHELGVDLLLWVAPEDPVKLSRLRLHNHSARTRCLLLTAYVEWALGANGSVPAPFVSTWHDEATGALLAKNTWRAEFHERIAFMDLGRQPCTMTGDRLEFLGRYGSVERPRALLENLALSGRLGAGLSPCGALQTMLELAPGEQREVRFLLGEADSADAARTLVEKYRAADLDTVLGAVRRQWDALLDTVQVSTPDRALDILLNDWLLYQALGCRMWARTAYYQASGAYGFRDQLQDAMALCVARPDLAREHLLRAAARQFIEGDVQHWWLPPAGQGIRTRIRDDRLWLAYVAAHYVETTGDAAVLEEMLPFLDGPPLKDGQTDAFYLPQPAAESASVYEHAARAIDTSLTLGTHGLPLIGTGDWNDGMNNVGAEGRGESVWLAWFALAAIRDFLPYALARGEHARAGRWQAYASALLPVLDGAAGWDGQWYRRGYYDDGTPLGSHTSSECRIDTIAQSWSLIAGGGDRCHAAQAMASVEHHLIRHDDQLALLFTPPFDHTPLNPGYIKGYPPGIRENGGQYTHGATWSIFAWAALGQGERAAALFDLLNPIRHSDCAAAIARYQVEPYVACADVYSVSPHTGRGGWTWYTGSAGWLYRAGLEAILGFHKRGDQLWINPCIPAAWPGFELVYRHRGPAHGITRYRIAVDNPAGVSRGVASFVLDGTRVEGDRIALVDDGRQHQVRVTLGPDAAKA